MKKLYLFVILIIIIVTVGIYILTNQDKNKNTLSENNTSQNESTQSATENKKFSLEEIAIHDSENDCYLIIDAKVYDVTSFISSHPGGEAILQGCGTDATDLFETRPMGSSTPHSQSARNLLQSYYIGDLI